MSAKVIVTGGAGFIGRNLVAHLNRCGEDDILVVDRLGRADKWRNLVGLRFDDYLDKAAFRERVLADRVATPKVVFHLGACSSTTETDADYLADNNTRYTRELCEWALRKGARFIYASSAATYGDGALGYHDDDAVTPRLAPLNMYGYSKHMFDLWALRRGLFDRIVGLKYFNVYGPFEAHKGEQRSVVHKAYGQVRETGRLSLFKSHRPDFRDGEQLRDFVYVRDAVLVTAHFAEHREASGLFNCGTGRARTWLDLAHAVFRAMKRAPQIEFIDMPEALRARYQYRTEADARKLRRAGYTAPFASVEDGVAEYVNDCLEKGLC